MSAAAALAPGSKTLYNALTLCQGVLHMPEPLERLLLRVQKPARYVGGEFNEVVKDLSDVKLRSENTLGWKMQRSPFILYSYYGTILFRIKLPI